MKLRTFACLIIICVTYFYSLNSACAESQAPYQIRVAVYIGAGAHEKAHLHEVLIAQKDFSVKEINGEDISEGDLKDCDVLLVPGGSGKNEANSLGAEGCDAVRKFVANGGAYVGICAGCYLATGGLPQYLGILPADLIDRGHQHWHRGRANLRAEVTPFGHEILGLKENDFTVAYHNGPVFKQSTACGEGKLTPLAIYRDEVVAPGGEVGVMVGSPAMVLASYHKGIVIGISPHPEATPGLENVVPHVIRWVWAHHSR
jgi:glutamine amidotransferase-like uncharacterized protein